MDLKNIDNIKELRKITGLSQNNFAKEYGIPVRTLQQWEQNRYHPAPYTINMIKERIASKRAVDIDSSFSTGILNPSGTKILIVGQGSFGKSISHYLEGKGYKPYIWVRGMSFDNLANYMDYIIFAIPAQSFREVFTKAAPYIGNAIVINLAKGIELGSLKRLSEVALEIKPDVRYAALSGPSHAEEIGKGLPTDVAISSDDSKLLPYIQDLLFNENFRVYTNEDLIGLEVGGAVKNIIAIAAGISDGLKFGDNARAALMTRGLAEMRRLGEAMGANPLTFLGLSGAGDLIVTCGSMYSRNKRLGLLIGSGKSLPESLKEIGQVAEGVSTCHAVYELARRLNVDMPITTLLHHLLNDEISLEQAVNLLISRKRKSE